MDESTGHMVAGILVGLLVGVPAGLLTANVKSSWAKFVEAKKAVGPAKKKATAKTGEAVLLGFLLLMVVALALGARHNV